jgi:hypothetical protein
MWHLYVSYPPHDEPFALRLVSDLQAAGYAVFVDAASEVGTLAWAAETRRAIRTCGAAILILELAGRRRLGIRHEGIAANRRRKPVYVLVRSPGDLPRYLHRATVIDGTGEYESALHELRAALPPAQALLDDPVPALRRRWRARPGRRARRRVLLWWGGALGVILLCLLLGIVLGLIPV